MKKKEQRWIQVTNKLTYLWLLCIPLGIIKMIYDYNAQINVDTPNMSQFIIDVFIAFIIIAVGCSMFVKFNTHSQWMNPDHPKPKQ